MSDCIFCQIIAGELPSTRILETDDVLAFFTIGPVRPGHTLVVPKRHSPTFIETPTEDVAAVMGAAQQIGAAMLKSGLADGINIGVNNGASAAQTVFHIHAHVIPRMTDDGLQRWPTHDVDPEEGNRLAQQLRENLTF